MFSTKGCCERCVFGTGNHSEQCELTDIWLLVQRKPKETEMDWLKRCGIIKNIKKPVPFAYIKKD